jgi:hypothetical protein
MRIRCPFGRVPRSKPSVPTSTTCPSCRQRNAVAVRAGRAFYTRFWYCTRECGWACWRPPAPWKCGKCKGPTVWAASRRSVGCVRCGHRVPILTV